jgi:hypothetical protein
MKRPYKHDPTKQKNDIRHTIKRRLVITIHNIFPIFKLIYNKVLGVFNNQSWVAIDEFPNTMHANFQLKIRISYFVIQT